MSPDFDLKSYNWPTYLRQMISRTNLDAFDRGEIHLIANAIEKLETEDRMAKASDFIEWLIGFTGAVRTHPLNEYGNKILRDKIEHVAKELDL